MAHKKASAPKLPIEKLPYFSAVTEDAIFEVFTCWVDTFWNGKGRRPKMSPTRENAIKRGIALVGKERALRAVRGCAMSEFHMGQNDQGKVYNSLELIFRDEWRVKKFASMAVEEE